MSEFQAHGPHGPFRQQKSAQDRSLLDKVLQQEERTSPSKTPPNAYLKQPHRHVRIRPACPITVLFADDDDDLQRAVTQRLREAGYRVLTAKDGNEALVRVERDRPDVLVLDIVMPCRSGVSVLQRLATVSSGPKVVLTTASPDWRPECWLSQPNVIAFLPKPFDADTLLATLQAVHREQQRAAELESHPYSAT